MNKILIIISAAISGAVISGGIVYLILNKEIHEWQLVIRAQEERLSALQK